jgi:hypothetical protein
MKAKGVIKDADPRVKRKAYCPIAHVKDSIAPQLIQLLNSQTTRSIEWGSEARTNTHSTFNILCFFSSFVHCDLIDCIFQRFELILVSVELAMGDLERRKVVGTSFQ